jgi:arginine repressor
MNDGSKSHAQHLVEERTKRPLDELLRELYLDGRYSQREIADALSVDGARISRATISTWLREYGITRVARSAVIL